MQAITGPEISMAFRFAAANGEFGELRAGNEIRAVQINEILWKFGECVRAFTFGFGYVDGRESESIYEKLAL
ncbi:hypothetical protein ACFX2I_015035 [Malus domestica]